MGTLSCSEKIIFSITYPEIFPIAAIYPLNSEKYRMRVTM
jgi:hypothetical protein